MAVFQPNLTSRLILRQALQLGSEYDGDWLEIGAGSGWITSELRRANPDLARRYCMSDISSEAISKARDLCDWVHPNDLRVGANLEPWKGSTFQVIINDVAGIADPIAEISDWYSGVPFSAGRDGLANSEAILADIEEILTPLGAYIVPIISLSDTKKHLSLLGQIFKQVKLNEKTLWPLPVSLSDKPQVFQELLDDSGIEVVHKYGKILAWTAVAVCSN